MRLNENYTFEGAADRCGQDLASVRCVSSLQNSPGTRFKSFSWGRKAGKYRAQSQLSERSIGNRVCGSMSHSSCKRFW
ncbi:hypothetical protein TNCV_579191 [Trichonephila clavipes]|nr:hypothetical protein TNCV_579191 [Trichonephila clavipes]